MAVAALLLGGCGSDAGAGAGAAGGKAAGPATADGGASSSLGSAEMDAGKSCVTDSDCDDHDACTHDRCAWSGEFASCENLSSADSCNGAPVPPGFLDPIDPACAEGASTSSGPFQGGPGKKGEQNALFPPYVPLKPDDVPASCNNGFELQQAQPSSIYLLKAKTPQGSRAITLDVDFATYTVADGMTITEIDASGSRNVLLDTCRMRTWTSADPTGGAHRPPDETIRQFRISLAAGTAQLEIKFGQVVSPMYLRLVGLCDFDVTPFPSALRWSSVP
jgi:hypothetical protein